MAVVPIVAGLIGALAMTACLGPSLVNPSHIEWLMHGDYRLHFLGWHLYRHGPWTLPIGATPLLIWPIGSSIGLTDSIPIAAFVFKVLDPLLPAAFQFIGLWLVASFALQGVFGALLMRLATPRPALQLLGATLFILSPPLIYRIVHAALTAHWSVLAALWLSLRSDADAPSRRLLGAWTILVGITAATQPYLLLMVVVVMLAAHARQLLSTPSRVVTIVAHAAIALAVAGVALWQAGSFMVRSDDGLEIGGFGGWSANLLTFIMPTEATSWLSPGPFAYASHGQYEGYAYLGGGTLLLGIIVLVAAIPLLWRSVRWRSLWRYLPLTMALIFLAAMAVGPVVTLGSRTLAVYDVNWWGPLMIFRTNGRMIWPLYYAIVALILFGASRLPGRWAVALCLGAVVIQAADLAGMTRYVRDARVFGFRDPLESRFWTVAPSHYQRFVLVPTNLCTREGYVDYSAFSLLAGRYGMAINSGVTARYDVQRAEAYCRELEQELRDGMRAAGSLYIVRADLVARLAPPTDGPVCTVVDGFGVCFSGESYARWQGTFDIVRSRLPPTDEFVRFYDELNETYRTTLKRPAREAAAAAPVRIDGLVRYLSYRMEGCEHREAEDKTLRHVEGTEAGRANRLCGAVSLHHALPPANETYAFGTQLDAVLRQRRGASPTSTHVDLEGEAVWIEAYARERTRGLRELEARAAVLAAVRDAGR